MSVLGRMLHVEDMDAGRYSELAVVCKQREADATCLLLEDALWGPGDEGRDVPSWIWVFDRWFSSLSFELRAVHVRVDDAMAQSCMGLLVGRLSCLPLCPIEAAMGAPHRQVELLELKLYCDSTLHAWPATAEQPHMYILQVRPPPHTYLHTPNHTTTSLLTNTVHSPEFLPAPLPLPYPLA